jgi:hypothetical protein
MIRINKYLILTKVKRSNKNNYKLHALMSQEEEDILIKIRPLLLKIA